MKILNKRFFLTGSTNKKVLDTVLNILNLAIKCDSNYFRALNNKVTVLSWQGKYNELMKTIDKLLVLTKNDPVLVTYKGIYFEKSNHFDSANAQYKKAETIYSDKMKLYPDSMSIKGNYLFLVAVMGGKDKAISKFNDYSKKYKNNPKLLQYKDLLDSFDKNDFMQYTGLH